MVKKAGDDLANGAKGVANTAANATKDAIKAGVTLPGKTETDVKNGVAHVGQETGVVLDNAGKAAASGALKPVAGDILKASNDLADSSKALAERTGDVARAAGHDVNVAKTATAKALSVAAQDTGRAAAKVTLDAAHIAIALGEDEKDHATAEIKSTLANARNTVVDVRDGRLGHAVLSLAEAGTSALAAVSGSATVQDASSLYGDAIDFEHETLAAVSDIRNGHFGNAASDMGIGLTDAGAIVGQADPASGAILSQAGAAVSEDTPYAEATVKDLKQGDLRKASSDAVAPYFDPIKTAIANARAAETDAKNGAYGEATLEATTVVMLVASNAPNETDVTKSVQSAQVALGDAKAVGASADEGRYGDAAENAGDAITALGQSLAASDPDDSQELTTLGTNIHEYAAHGKDAAATLRQTGSNG